MRLSFVVLAVALQAIVPESSAQEARPPANAYAGPAEHNQFVQQFQLLLEKFPEAKRRFKLADMGDADEHKEFHRQFKLLVEKFPQAKRHFSDTSDVPIAGRVEWKCTEFPPGSNWVDCSPKVE